MEDMETEPGITEVVMGFKFRNEELPEVIRLLGLMSVDDPKIRLGQGEFGFRSEIDRQALAHTVTLESARYFNKELFNHDKPSPIGTRVFGAIAFAVDQSEVTFENDDPETGRPVSITRKAWDEEMARIESGESEITWRPKTVFRRFVREFSAYMPEQAEAGE